MWYLLNKFDQFESWLKQWFVKLLQIEKHLLSYLQYLLHVQVIEGWDFLVREVGVRDSCQFWRKEAVRDSVGHHKSEGTPVSQGHSRLFQPFGTNS